MNALRRFLSRKTVETAPDVEEAALRSDRFRLARQDEWMRLEAIVRRMEAGNLRKIPDGELLELPALYRTAASSLSVARETSLDAATLAYLESLVQRAWFQVYGPRLGFIGWLRRFFGGGWSASVRAIWLDICIAFAVMAAGTLVGWMLADSKEEWYYALVPSGMGDARVPGASAEALKETLKGTQDASGLSLFASYLFSHNAGIAIMAFALGFAFGMPSLLLLVQNAAVLGAMLWLFNTQGLGLDFAAWLSIHGTTELFAILLAGAAGLHIGRNMAFPGSRSILAAAAASGRRGAQVMVGVVLMLMVAGLLEGFARQLVHTTPARLAVGGSMLAFWLLYLFGFRARRDLSAS